MSKTIVITGNDVQLKNALEKNIGNFPELEIVFAMPYGEEMIGNLSIAQPNFVICDFIYCLCSFFSSPCSMGTQNVEHLLNLIGGYLWIEIWI